MKENFEKAKEVYDYFRQLINDSVGKLSWDWKKDRSERTKFLLAALSFAINGYYGEWPFFNPMYFEDAISYWKDWLRNDPRLTEGLAPKIRKYESLIQDKLAHELGERLVDLCSSPSYPPTYLDFAVEYESLPYWHCIIFDFRKLLYISAHIKIGIFHLPSRGSTKKAFYFDDEGRMKDDRSYLSWKDLLENLLMDMKREIEGNFLENPSTVYLFIFIHETKVKEVETMDIYGYLYNREKSGQVTMQILSSPVVEKVTI